MVTGTYVLSTVSASAGLSINPYPIKNAGNASPPPAETLQLPEDQAIPQTVLPQNSAEIMPSATQTRRSRMIDQVNPITDTTDIYAPQLQETSENPVMPPIYENAPFQKFKGEVSETTALGIQEGSYTAQQSEIIDDVYRPVARNTLSWPNGVYETPAPTSGNKYDFTFSDDAVAGTMDVPSQKQTIMNAVAFTAHKGASLKSVLSEWCLQEGADLVWYAYDDFRVKDNIEGLTDYSQAVAEILEQFQTPSVMVQPVGNLHVDPNTGQKVLVITEQGGQAS